MLLVYIYRIKLFKLAPVIIFILIISLFKFYFLTNNEIIILSLYFIVKNTNTHTHTPHLHKMPRLALFYQLHSFLRFAKYYFHLHLCLLPSSHVSMYASRFTSATKNSHTIGLLGPIGDCAFFFSSSHDYNYWLRLRSSVGARITNLLHLFVLLSSLPISSLVCVEISFNLKIVHNFISILHGLFCEQLMFSCYNKTESMFSHNTKYLMVTDQSDDQIKLISNQYYSNIK